MEIYDTANKLATEIKESEEYKKFKKLKENLKSNSELKEKMEKFEKARYDAQIIQLQTGKEDEEKNKEMVNLYSELIQNETAKNYFDAEMKFNIILTDVNKIIGEAVQDVLE